MAPGRQAERPYDRTLYLGARKHRAGTVEDMNMTTRLISNATFRNAAVAAACALILTGCTSEEQAPGVDTTTTSADAWDQPVSAEGDPEAHLEAVQIAAGAGETEQEATDEEPLTARPAAPEDMFCAAEDDDCREALAEGQHPDGLAGVNFGDLPAWGEVDIEAIGAELDRYRAEAEAAAAEAAAAATAPVRGNATPPTSALPETSSGGSDETTIGTTKDELIHQCFTLDIVAACDAYWDFAVSNPPEDTGPSPAPAPEDDQTDYTIDFGDHSEADAWWQEMGERAQQAIVEQCDGRGGSSTWDMDGNITVDCN